jgi:hypothetical protein
MGSETPVKTHAVRTTYVVVVLAVTLLTTVGLASSEVFVTMQSLTTDLESRDIDRIDKSLNDIKTMSYKGEILPFVADLWGQRKAKHSGLPWDVIETELVRVELADILLQAVKNGRTKLALNQCIALSLIQLAATTRMSLGKRYEH